MTDVAGVVWVNEYLAAVSAAIRQEGWVSRARAREMREEKGVAPEDGWDPSTASVVWRELRQWGQTVDGWDRERAQKVILWAKQGEGQEEGEFRDRLAKAVNEGTVDVRTVGTLAAGVYMWERVEGYKEKIGPLAPDGKATVRGEVLAVKRVETAKGGVAHKMMVRCEDQNLVWVTVPRRVIEDVGGRVEDVRGALVEVTAVWFRSVSDDHFASGKNPVGRVVG